MTKKKLIILISAMGVALIAAAGICLLLYTLKFRANTIRLYSYEGEVKLVDDKGRSIEVKEDKRLTSGNVLSTKKESRAWVLLDEDRMVTLMEKSKAGFDKKGNRMVLTLEDGSLFFNIEKPLSDKESFEISTSTMVIGIRGTSGYVSADEDGNSVLYLTSGKCEVTGIGPDGDTDSVTVRAGEKVTVIIEDDEVELIVEDITETDLPKDAVIEIVSDDDLLEAVTDATGWDEDLLGELTEDKVSDLYLGEIKDYSDVQVCGDWILSGDPYTDWDTETLHFSDDGTGYEYLFNGTYSAFFWDYDVIDGVPTVSLHIINDDGTERDYIPQYTYTDEVLHLGYMVYVRNE